MLLRYKNTEIRVSKDVYEPSEDSFLLAEAALSEIEGSERVLEVGCGSGMIAAVIKANTKAEIVGIDINPHAARCTKANGIEAIRGDILSCIKGEFDIIIFNPPYLPTHKEERTGDWINVALDGGHDGRRIIHEFLNQAAGHLAKSGRILMVLSSLTGTKEVESRMESLGYCVETKSEERFMFEKLIVVCATKE
jgi:release factor glutamine methyltransferase